MSENKLGRMKELTAILNQAAKAYYQEDREIMSNLEYDRMYDELQQLEEETGTVLADSPTIHVGYEAVNELPKEVHDSPMLSLDKTKDPEVLRSFIGSHKSLLSWKLDGLTIVLTYDQGQLQKAVTRGNGLVGEVITNNAKVFRNIPLRIPFQGRLVLRGEAIITYDDFEKINAKIENVDAKYKNPRNLCSGSVRQLNNEITARRNVRFFAFGLVSAEGVDFENSRERQFQWLKSQGFEVVEYRVVTSETLDDAMEYFEHAIVTNPFPSDGLVTLYDDIAYGESLGSTAKFPRNSFAFKWADEQKETHLLEMEWSPSRTGLINPVAIFEPVELEGTTVKRASVHNVSMIRSLGLGIGDLLRVYKANMIIPQIAENLTRSNTLEIPETCPACGGATKIRRENDAESLYCMNPDCPAKKIKSFALFTSRDAMNIEGLSEATLEKFIAHGFIHRLADVYELQQHEDEILQLDGFGKKSYEKLVDSIQKSRTTTLAKLIYALGIPNIGLANAKVICRYFEDDAARMLNAGETEISGIESIGPVIARNFVNYFANSENRKQFDQLCTYLTLQKEEKTEEQQLSGKTFVITGSVEHFANRSEMKSRIESLGGKVTGSVTKNTDFLINNDRESSSTKNRKAKELGVAIITEDEFLEMISGKEAEHAD